MTRGRKAAVCTCAMHCLGYGALNMFHGIVTLSSCNAPFAITNERLGLQNRLHARIQSCCAVAAVRGYSSPGEVGVEVGVQSTMDFEQTGRNLCIQCYYTLYLHMMPFPFALEVMRCWPA